MIPPALMVMFYVTFFRNPTDLELMPAPYLHSSLMIQKGTSTKLNSWNWCPPIRFFLFFLCSFRIPGQPLSTFSLRSAKDLSSVKACHGDWGAWRGWAFPTEIGWCSTKYGLWLPYHTHPITPMICNIFTNYTRLSAKHIAICYIHHTVWNIYRHTHTYIYIYTHIYIYMHW